MSTDDDLALRPVIDHHLREAIRLMKATGEGADPSVWDELRIYMPPATGMSEIAISRGHDAAYGKPGKG
jgi:hypothetical protein